MRTFAVVAALAAFTSPVSATIFGGPDTANNAEATSRAVADARSSSRSSAVSVQGQMQGQAQGQRQTARGGNAYSEGSQASAATGPSSAQSSSGGNSQSMVYNEAQIPTVTKSYIEHKGTQRIANTPDIGVFAPAPTAPCIVTWGAGGSGPGLGLGLSGWKEDEGCTVREIRRIAADNPAIVNAADEYLLDAINERREKQKVRKMGWFGQPKGGFGY